MQTLREPETVCEYVVAVGPRRTGRGRATGDQCAPCAGGGGGHEPCSPRRSCTGLSRASTVCGGRLLTPGMAAAAAAVAAEPTNGRRPIPAPVFAPVTPPPRGARTTMLSCRPAPIQITYLGLPATTGLPCIDYVLADHFLIPEEFAHYYSEKPLLHAGDLPDQRQTTPVRPAAVTQQLWPAGERFVFCSFNNNKSTLEIFEAWMRILHRAGQRPVAHYQTISGPKRILRKQAATHGVDEHRLVFSERTRHRITSHVTSWPTSSLTHSPSTPGPPPTTRCG